MHYTGKQFSYMFSFITNNQVVHVIYDKFLKKQYTPDFKIMVFLLEMYLTSVNYLTWF